eukprot:36032-Eustigmatos_ZCMA.PRE.1
MCVCACVCVCDLVLGRSRRDALFVANDVPPAIRIYGTHLIWYCRIRAVQAEIRRRQTDAQKKVNAYYQRELK